MERGIFQAYVASLEQIIENIHFDLREAMDQFRELCLMITPERIAPVEIITDIRQTYRHIQDQLAKIRGVKQLLEGKYRQYYHRDSRREREIMEFAFLAKSLYSKFGYTLEEMEAKRRLKDSGEHFKAYRQRIPYPWFQSKRNQIILLRNLRTLCELDYETRSDLEYEHRREVIRSGMRSVSLFAFSGEVGLIDNLQSRMRLREYDIKERLTRGELRGALTHLREISLPEVEGVIRRFVDTSEFSKLRCLLLTIQSQQDLEKEILGSAENMLHVMGMGELKILSI
ncbi:MAG: hypothetical protein ACLQGU_04420 [bacterium]